ncbi:glycosyltransferase [Bacillus alveayuensis]|uniref:glycosyltransferase n=1 Tax=Aeribacillus alveayuensis TaxID=279215 RepID=UPI0005CD3053|nr:glycosyltransferase [Bacillus alveayuensis]
MGKVAVVRTEYLPISETFIYNELVNLTKFSPVVFTKKLVNLDKFPFEPIIQYERKKDLLSHVQNHQVDLIHARFGIAGINVLKVKQKANLPMITSFHGFDLPSNQRVYEKYYRDRIQDLFEEGELFTVASKYMKNILMEYGCPEEKIVVHYSGIDIHHFPFEPKKKPHDGEIIILSVGRLVHKKGMDLLIEAFSFVSENVPHVKLRIAGDGPLREKLENQIKKLNLTEKVKLLGAISHGEVAQEMRNASFFVLASHTDYNGNQEGIPNVLKEAMACGLPVVSTRHAGIPELVSHGQSGFLAEENDSQDLAKWMIKMIQNVNKWYEMGKKGREIVTKDFHLQKQVQQLEFLYTNIINECKNK